MVASLSLVVGGGDRGTEITKHCKRQKDPNSGRSSWARLCRSVSWKDVLDLAGLGGDTMQRPGASQG